MRFGWLAAAAAIVAAAPTAAMPFVEVEIEGSFPPTVIFGGPNPRIATFYDVQTAVFDLAQVLSSPSGYATPYQTTLPDPVLQSTSTSNIFSFYSLQGPSRQGYFLTIDLSVLNDSFQNVPVTNNGFTYDINFGGRASGVINGTITRFQARVVNDVSNTPSFTDTLTTFLPEPENWAMMILGFGAIGCVLRRRSLPWAVFRVDRSG